MRSHEERRNVHSGTDPESYITKYTLVYENYKYLCLIDIWWVAEGGGYEMRTLSPVKVRTEI